MHNSAHLLNRANIDYYRRIVAAGMDRVAERVAAAERPWTGTTPDRLAAEISAIDLERPLGDPATALAELDRIYLRDAVYFHHPRYLAHLNCPVVIPALLGEAVLSAINSSLDTWDQSAGGTLVERRLIEWTTTRLGLGDGADGVFTSGGTQSNLQALVVARAEARRLQEKDLGEGGGAGGAQPGGAVELLPRLRILTTAYSHFSVTKAATLLGLDRTAVVPVAHDRRRRMRPDALAGELDRCRGEGLVPMAVVATAGTTDFGSIDPLREIAQVCRRAGVWLHVDAAYGCGLLVSRRRHLLDGIESADSVTVDYHKSFFQPVSSSAVLVRDRSSLADVTYHADYLNPARSAAENIPNQVDKSLQTTRRFDALKLWLTLRIMGPEAVGELFDQVVDRAAEAGRMLERDRRFEIVTQPQLSTLVFRYAPEGVKADPARLDAANRYARSALAASGAGVVAGTVVDGRHYLKFTLLNPATTMADLADVLDLLAGHASSGLEGPAASRWSGAEPAVKRPASGGTHR